MNDRTPPSRPDVEWHLPHRPRSVGRARTLLLEQAYAWHIPDDITETAALLLSELMTNAVEHARVPPGRHIAARCHLRDDTLRIEVSDANSTLPLARPVSPSPDDERGRGLLLVTALADAWDAHPRAYGIGKTVWFELKLPVITWPFPPAQVTKLVHGDTAQPNDSLRRFSEKHAQRSLQPHDLRLESTPLS